MFLDLLLKLQEHPENFRITAVQSKALRKFFKKECVNEKTGEKGILDAFGIDIPAKLYRHAELRSIKTEIKVFM